MTYTNPPRCPDVLLAADIPDWQKAVWLAIRSVQGGNATAWADYSTYGDRCNKSLDMTRKAVGKLKKGGWLEEVKREGNTRHLRCLVPDSDRESCSENPAPGMSDREQGSQVTGNVVPGDREQGSQSPTPPYKEEPVQESVQEPVQPRGARKRGGADRFEDWWAVYPKKRAKKACRAKWKARGLDAMADDLIADVQRRLAHDQRWTRGYAPDPSTYLNQDRWEDELTEPTRSASAVDAAKERAAIARANPERAFQEGALEAFAAIDPGFGGMDDPTDHEVRRLGN